MRRTAGVLLLLIALSLAVLAQRYTAPNRVVNSPHDLSVTSSATYKAATPNATPQNQVCVFCHTPHNANPAAPLWNHTRLGTSYTLYGSSTLTATMAQPTMTDNTRLCLSCHDGTVALGNTVNNGSITMANSVTTLPATAGNAYSPPRSTNLGTTLADDHPVAFTPTIPVAPAYPQVQAPPAGDPIALESGKLQCTGCHNPHEEAVDTTERRFLRKSNSAAAICTTCHVLQGSAGGSTNAWNWNAGPSSDHKTHTNTYNTSTNDPGDSDSAFLGAHTSYTAVNTNACEACHRPHTSHNNPRLLKGVTAQVCFQCHDGNATSNLRNPPANTVVQNIKNAFVSKTYKHPGSTVAGSSGATDAGHDPNESPTYIGTRHAACDDCHNPHAAKGYESAGAAFPVPPNMPSSLWGASGATATLNVGRNPRAGTGDALYQYEICFKCHAESSNKPQTTQDNGAQRASLTGIGYGYLPKHMWDYQTSGNPTNLNWSTALSTRANLRLKFTDHTTYPSYHPVVDPRGLPLTQVPTLRAYVKDASGNDITSRPLTINSIIYCTDCHNNDTGRDTVSTRSGTTSPAGPHGSANAHLLERPVESLSGGTRSSTNQYGLCGKCHNIASHLFDVNVGAHNQRCTFCHDPHGSRSIYLISWDGADSGASSPQVSYVTVSSVNQLWFRATYPYACGSSSPNYPQCYVNCHGHTHAPEHC